LDLARIAPLPTEHKLFELRHLKAFKAPYTLNPVRRNELDIFDVQSPLGGGARPPWSVIQENILRLGKRPEEDNANIRVGEALYRFAEAHKITGRQRDDIFPLLIGASERLSYWFNAVLAIDGVPTLAFVDPRTGAKLHEDGRRFVFSVQHERIRAYPHVKGVRLGIVQVRAVGNSSERLARLISSDGVELFTADELGAMVQETYQLWHLVLAEREEELKRGGGGRKGPLGF
jgi:hypothetical protein